jgi:hypothetical protein
VQDAIQSSTLKGNVVYGNTQRGLQIRASTGWPYEAANNTVYQPQGDAVRIDGDSRNATLKNNVLWVGAGYAISVADNSQQGFASDYNVLHLTGTGKLARWQGRDFTSREDWFYEVGQDQHSLTSDPRFVDVGAEDFRLRVDSPAVDRGDPVSLYDHEPSPNGGRIDIGAYGNTADATASPAQLVQVLSPSGLEKIEQGQDVSLRWHSAGLYGPAGYYRDTILADAPLAYYRLNDSGASATDLSGNGRHGSYLGGVAQGMAGALSSEPDKAARFDGVDDQITVADDAGFRPTRVSIEAWIRPDVGNDSDRGIVMKTSTSGWTDGYGLAVDDGKLSFFVNNHQSNNIQAAIPAERWSHVVGTYDGAALRLYVNGELVATKAFTAAIVHSAQPLLIGSEPIGREWKGALDEVAVYGQALTAERIREHYERRAFGSVTIDVVAADGTTAHTATVETFNDGEFLWTVPDSLTPGAYRLRVTAHEGSQPQGLSAESFTVADGGTEYYVNDDSLAGDEFTTATGDNANDGKSPSRPMATLAALLSAYDLGPGDVVHVDAGTYQLLRNAVISSQDAGVRIEGPTGAAALLKRGNTATGSYAIELVNADGVTLEQLSVTGGVNGIFASTTSDSDHVTLRRIAAFGNASGGVRLDYGNDHATVQGSTFHSQPHYGLYVDGDDALITGNTAFDNGNTIFTQGTGIWVRGPRSLVEGNEVHGNWDGIYAVGPLGDAAQRIVVRANRVHDNMVNGIEADTGVLVVDNVIFGQRNGAGTIFVGTGLSIGRSGSEAQGNTIYDNVVGISANATTIRGNRVFNNAGAGIDSAGSRVEGNRVYANATGIVASQGNGSVVANNLIYANSDRGLAITANSGQINVANNTIYQPAGQAFRLDSGSQNISLRNNILWTDAGYDVFIVGTPTGFSSDYNLLLTSADPSSHVGFWNNANRHSLADWQTASAQDAHSLIDNPQFVDINGADNILGYTAAGGGHDGGSDDNFHLSKNSPAIDRGHSWAAFPGDIEGPGRSDDPGTANAGSIDYVQSNVGNLFALTGTARNWRSDNSAWTLTLPFAFPFYDASYTSVTVSSEGFLHFAGLGSTVDSANSTDKLLANRRIAPLWDNLRTDRPGDDIFVDTSISGQVTIRWSATAAADESDVNFAVTLFQDGQVRFDYGPGNSNLTPTVGISFGNGRTGLLSSHDGKPVLANAASVAFSLAPGHVDIGAHEFRGSSLDVTPPSVVSIVPLDIVDGVAGRLRVTFTEALNPVDANAKSNYELRGAGDNGIFGDADDVIFDLTPHYTAGALSVVLDVADGLPLTPLYRLSVSGSSTIHDLSGLALDGDGDGQPGGNFVRTDAIKPAGVTVTAAVSQTTEAGAVTTFTVVLDNRPAADVVITLAVDDQVTAGPASLRFTPDNWSTPQSVTVSAVDDQSAEGAHFGMVTLTAASADQEFDAIPIAPVTVGVSDNDTAGLTITPTDGSTAVSEAGTSESYTVKLSSKPTAAVTITLVTDAQLAVTPQALTFTPDNWDTPQTVTVTAMNDAVAEGAHTGTITYTAASADATYDGLAIAPQTVDVTDNDAAGIVIGQSGGTTTVEEGGLGDTFTVALTSRPTAAITVTLASGTQLGVTPPTLTFTPDNWNLPQTVSVSAVNDRVAEGSHAGIVSYTVSGDDPQYSGLAGTAVSVAIADNDTAGVLVTPSGGWTALAEGGATDTYTVVLTSRPAADVVVSLTPGSQVGASVSTLTFTPADWETPQTVTVTALDDLLVEGGHTGAVTHTAKSADPAYNGVVVADVVAGIADNEAAGVLVTPTEGGTAVVEGGATDTYTVVLISQPTADVTVTLTVDPQLFVAPVTLTFTPDNWNVAQTVTVEAVNDEVFEGDHSGTISHTASSADPAYNNATVPDLVAVIADNDTAGVLITPTGGSTAVAEGGATDTYMVVLTSRPTANVTVTLTADQQLSVAPVTLTFTSDNWNVAQMVTVAAVNDDVFEGDHTGTISHAASSADPAYNNVTGPDLVAGIADNDTAGVLITPTGGSTAVVEGGATDTYTVALTSKPTANVTVTMAADAQVSVSPVTLTFTPNNWNVPQTVTVAAVNDGVFEGNHSGTISHTATSADGNYDGILISQVTANITDDDVVGDELPPGAPGTVEQRGDNLVITGTAGHDVITVERAKNDRIVVRMNGTRFGPYTTAGRIAAHGLDGNDLITVSPVISKQTLLSGGGGRDTVFGGAGKDVLLGGDDNDRLIGGPGADVLVGGAGSDTLRGGGGRDVLFGGGGKDALFGGAADDLLLGGLTAFDSDTRALDLIAAEWASARPYPTRVANLEGSGTGDRANGNVFLVPSSTVLDDGAVDKLLGESGRDWFFRKRTSAADALLDRKTDEIIRDL